MGRCADFLENPFRNITASAYPLARKIAAAGGMKHGADEKYTIGKEVSEREEGAGLGLI